MASLLANLMVYLSLSITGTRIRALKLKASCEEQIMKELKPLRAAFLNDTWQSSIGIPLLCRYPPVCLSTPSSPPVLKTIPCIQDQHTSSAHCILFSKLLPTLRFLNAGLNKKKIFPRH